MSTSSATKREPRPASDSSSDTPSGVAMRSVSCTPVLMPPSLDVARGCDVRRARAAATASSMHPDAFAAARGPAWDELAGFTPRRAGASRRLAGRRHAAARSALSRGRGRPRLRPPALRRRRRHAPGGDARRARAAARLRRPAARGSLRAYLAHGYWRAIAERPRPLLAAWLLMLVPAMLAGLWALSDPAAAGGLVPAAPAQRGRAPPPRPRPARRRRARRRLDRHLREQHPGHVPGLCGRASRSAC